MGPDGFFPFWQETLAALSRVPANPRLGLAEVAQRLGAGQAHVVFHGRSYGGALALLAQGVTSRADYLAVALPTLGWLDGRRRLVTRGSGQEVNEHLARRPRLEAAAMATLRYFDFDERWTAAVAALGARESIAR